MRRQQLLEVISPALIAAVAQNFGTALRTPNACDVAFETVNAALGPKQAILDEIARLTQETGDDSIVAHNVAHRWLGRLVQITPEHKGTD